MIGRVGREGGQFGRSSQFSGMRGKLQRRREHFFGKD